MRRAAKKMGPRSHERMYWATRQPALALPSMRCAGTWTSTNDVEQNSSTSAIVRRGLALTPGVSMSTRNALTPRDPGSPVLARTTQRVACCAKLVHSFSPLISQSSPCARALVRSDPRSLPAPGSEKPWHQNSSPRSSRGNISSTTSGRPNSATAGPRTSCIDHDVVCTRARLVSSSPSTARSMGEPPNPPRRFGQPHRIQPSSNSIRWMRRW
jgi:hypothetical protein